jgi:hypothetical protein
MIKKKHQFFLLKNTTFCTNSIFELNFAMNFVGFPELNFKNFWQKFLCRGEKKGHRECRSGLSIVDCIVSQFVTVQSEEIYFISHSHFAKNVSSSGSGRKKTWRNDLINKLERSQLWRLENINGEDFGTNLKF